MTKLLNITANEILILTKFIYNFHIENHNVSNEFMHNVKILIVTIYNFIFSIGYIVSNFMITFNDVSNLTLSVNFKCLHFKISRKSKIVYHK